MFEYAFSRSEKRHRSHEAVCGRCILQTLILDFEVVWPQSPHRQLNENQRPPYGNLTAGRLFIAEQACNVYGIKRNLSARSLWNVHGAVHEKLRSLYICAQCLCAGMIALLHSQWERPPGRRCRRQRGTWTTEGRGVLWCSIITSLYAADQGSKWLNLYHFNETCPVFHRLL